MTATVLWYNMRINGISGAWVSDGDSNPTTQYVVKAM